MASEKDILFQKYWQGKNVNKTSDKNINTYTVNRELSWLKFNQRVLEEAVSESNPLFEQLKFLSIFVSNLDEFFMIRVGSLYDQTLFDSMPVDNKSGMSAKEQLDSIFNAVRPLYVLKDSTFRTITKGLENFEIRRTFVEKLDQTDRKFIDKYFISELQPLLSPQIIDTHHPFPHLPNKMLYIATILSKKGKDLYGLIPVNSNFNRVVFLPGDSVCYILVEDIILYYAEQIFDIYDVTEKTVICVTRNADIAPEVGLVDEDVDYRQYMKEILKKRNRLAPVRLEVQRRINRDLKGFFCTKLNLKEKQVFISESPLDMSYIFDLALKIDEGIKSKLFYSKMVPKHPHYLIKNESMLKVAERMDLLLSYPYESIKPFLDLVRQAASDSSVISIKITLYRIARESKLAESLIMAAENGKEVTVLMELRARFDEQNNIEWANRLERAGCRVIYGFGGYKVHSKICLITKKEAGKLKYITQIGTGNYNEKTAELYTDLALITASDEIGIDAANFFKNMDLGNLNGEYKHLFVAPSSFKSKVITMINREIEKGSEGRIIIKINSITDKEIIDKLSEASNSGVKIDMIVRGICCILPRVENATENISIISIVGRFLEHSRIFAFGDGQDRKIYISSADFMTRNTERRVEIACPVLDRYLSDRIYNMLIVMLSDNEKARELKADGSYLKRVTPPDLVINSQEYFLQQDSEIFNEFVTMEYKKKINIFGNVIDTCSRFVNYLKAGSK